MLLAYKEGRASLFRLSKTLNMSLSEAIDFLASFGLDAPIHYDDYLAGADTSRKAVH